MNISICYSMHLHFDRLHLHNQSREQSSDTGYVERFGFEVPTCCGAIPMDNTWSSDWVVWICASVCLLLTVTALNVGIL